MILNCYDKALLWFYCFLIAFFHRPAVNPNVYSFSILIFTWCQHVPEATIVVVPVHIQERRKAKIAGHETSQLQKLISGGRKNSEIALFPAQDDVVSKKSKLVTSLGSWNVINSLWALKILYWYCVTTSSKHFGFEHVDHMFTLTHYKLVEYAQSWSLLEVYCLTAKIWPKVRPTFRGP